MGGCAVLAVSPKDEKTFLLLLVLAEEDIGGEKGAVT